MLEVWHKRENAANPQDRSFVLVKMLIFEMCLDILKANLKVFKSTTLS